MERDTTFKEHHFWELQRRDALNNSLSLHIGATTLLVGGAYTMAKVVSDHPGVASHFLSGGLLITVICLLATIFCIVRAIFGYGYFHFPDMNVKLRDRASLIAQYRKAYQLPEGLEFGDWQREIEARQKAFQSFHDINDETYSQSASMNAKQNNRKAFWIYLSNRFLVGSLVAFLISGIPYLAVTLGAPEKPTMVHIVKSEK